LDDPHFYFESNKMKMIQGDKVVARPVVLYLADVPLLALPYAVFPNKSGGRRSGWIMPGYGESKQDGQYLKGLGYFWAINDYMDETSTMNLFDRKGFQLHHRFRYMTRYKYRGNLKVSQFTTILNRNIADISKRDSTATKWFVEWNHSQTIDPTQHLNVSAKYISDRKTLRNYAMDRETRLKQQMLSSASYSKNWQNLTMSLALRETYDLNAETRLQVPPVKLGQKIVEKARTLPNISLSKKQQALFEGDASSKERWYNKIYWSANSTINNQQNIFWQAGSSADSLAWSSGQKTLNKFFIKNGYRINANQKVFRYIAVNLSASISQGIVPGYRKAYKDTAGAFRTDGSGKVEFNEIKKTAIRHTGNMSLSAQTNIYGMVPVRIGKYRAIRHVIKPSISFSYSPDFSKDFMGYNLEYFQKDSLGNLFDKFAGSAIGSTPRRESKSMSFSLGNLFQAKEELEGVENKVELLNWTMSGGYNFTADSLGLSPIRSSFRSPLLKNLHLDISMVHDFYRWDEVSHRRVNQLLKFPRLAQMSASSSLKLSGTRLGADKKEAQ